MKQLPAISRQLSARSGVRAVLGVVVLMGGFSARSFGQSKPVVLKGGKLLTVSHGVIEQGVLVMEGGKITAIGAEASVKILPGAQVIDVSGMTVYPGLMIRRRTWG